MEGLDKRWMDAGDRRMALYSRVPPGKYVFKVIASNDDGLWSESARTVSIDIPPSFIQSIWFQILCALVILLLLSLVYVLRFRQVNAQIRARLYERVAERERIARELHDTLLQGVLSASMQLVARWQLQSCPSSRHWRWNKFCPASPGRSHPPQARRVPAHPPQGKVAAPRARQTARTRPSSIRAAGTRGAGQT